MNKKDLGWGFLSSLLTVGYIAGVAGIIFQGEKWFGGVDPGWWAPVMFLSLFVFSALVTSTLMLGRPVWLYMNGENRQAVRAFLHSVGGLLIVVAVVFLIGISIRF